MNKKNASPKSNWLYAIIIFILVFVFAWTLYIIGQYNKNEKRKKEIKKKISRLREDITNLDKDKEKLTEQKRKLQKRIAIVSFLFRLTYTITIFAIAYLIIPYNHSWLHYAEDFLTIQAILLFSLASFFYLTTGKFNDIMSSIEILSDKMPIYVLNAYYREGKNIDVIISFSDNENKETINKRIAELEQELKELDNQ